MCNIKAFQIPNNYYMPTGGFLVSFNRSEAMDLCLQLFLIRHYFTLTHGGRVFTALMSADFILKTRNRYAKNQTPLRSRIFSSSETVKEQGGAHGSGSGSVPADHSAASSPEAAHRHHPDLETLGDTGGCGGGGGLDRLGDMADIRDR